MLQKLKSIIMSIGALFVLAVPLAVPAVASAQASPTNGACYGADKLQVTTSPNSACSQISSANGTGKVNSLITKIINVLSVIVGIIAVIMIIIGGLQYITSGGSSEKVSKAKNTILYAIIGLIIVALAQVIVRFVLNQTT